MFLKVYLFCVVVDYQNYLNNSCHVQIYSFYSVEADFNTKGLDVLSPKLPIGTYSRPRLLEVAAAINRFRGLRMLK